MENSVWSTTFQDHSDDGCQPMQPGTCILQSPRLPACLELSSQGVIYMKGEKKGGSFHHAYRSRLRALPFFFFLLKPCQKKKKKQSQHSYERDASTDQPFRPIFHWELHSDCVLLPLRVVIDSHWR